MPESYWNDDSRAYKAVLKESSKLSYDIPLVLLRFF